MKGKCPFGMPIRPKLRYGLANRTKPKLPIMIETSFKESEHKGQGASKSNAQRMLNTVEDSTDVLNLSKINIGFSNLMRGSNSMSDLNEVKPGSLVKDRYQQVNKTSFSFISEFNGDEGEFVGELSDLNETPTTICNYYQPSEHTSEKKKRANISSKHKNISMETKQQSQVGFIIPKADRAEFHQPNQQVIKVNRKKGLKATQKPRAKLKNINNSIMSLSSLSSVVNDFCIEPQKAMKPNNSLAEKSNSKTKNRTASINSHINKSKSNILNKEYNCKDHPSTKKTVHKPLVLYFNRLKFEGHLMMSPKNNEKTSTSKRENQSTNKSTIPSSSSAAKIKLNPRPTKRERGVNEMKISKTITEFTLHQKYLSSMKIKEKMEQTPKADRFIHINKKTSLTQQEVKQTSSPYSNVENYSSSGKHQPTHYIQQPRIHQSAFVGEERHRTNAPLCVTSNKKASNNFKKSNTQSSLKSNPSLISIIDSNGPCSVKQKLLDKMNKAVNPSLLQNACKNPNISPIFQSGKKSSFSSNKKDSLPQNTSLPLGKDNSKRIIGKNMNEIIGTPNKFSFSSNKKKHLAYYCMNSNYVDDEFFNS